MNSCLSLRDGTATETILSSGEPFQMGLNLWTSLRYLLRWAESQWYHIWVGAICIDQTNTKERTVQIRHMDEIYGGAIRVSVWPGAAPESPPYRWKIMIRYVTESLYWSRACIIQELLLAKRIILSCRENQITSDEFYGLFSSQYLSCLTGSSTNWPINNWLRYECHA